VKTLGGSWCRTCKRIGKETRTWVCSTIYIYIYIYSHTLQEDWEAGKDLGM
jgi:hypothetical protein